MGKYNPTYQCWADMRKRCNKPGYKDFHRYGGRGIKICARWELFSNFVADMGNRPDGKTLDRINNDGDYEPANCRWATPTEQQRNTSFNVLFSHNGLTMCKRDWEKKLGLSVGAISHRLKSGWDMVAAFTTPAIPNRHGRLSVNGVAKSIGSEQ